MESLFGKKEVLSGQTGITAETTITFLSNHWIPLKYLQLFPNARFLVLHVESLLVEKEVLSCQTGFTVEKGHNF